MKSTKIFFASVLLFGSIACGFRQTAEDNTSSAPQISEEIKTGIPFESKEPGAFQTEVVVTNFLNGEKTEKKYFIARAQNKSLTVFNRGEKTEHSILFDGRQTFFINPASKTFKETENGVSGAAADETLDFLTSRRLNQKADASFENLGTENNLTKYRVSLADSTASEIILTYDEIVKLPVKQEFYSILKGEKVLTMTVELRNFQTSTDEKLFVLPQDYKRAERK